MPHAPGHTPNEEEEKVIICGAAAKQHACGAVAGIETLSVPYGRHGTLLDAICALDDTFAGRLGPAEQAVCDAAEIVEKIIAEGVGALIAASA